MQLIAVQTPPLSFKSSFTRVQPRMKEATRDGPFSHLLLLLGALDFVAMQPRFLMPITTALQSETHCLWDESFPPKHLFSEHFDSLLHLVQQSVSILAG